MNPLSKSVLVITLGIFLHMNFAFAQGVDFSQQRIYQNQQPVSGPENMTGQTEAPLPNQPETQTQQQEEALPITAAQETSSSTGQTTSQIFPQESSTKSPASYFLYAIIAVLAFLGIEEWLRKWRKPKKKPELPAEAEKIVCETCGGSGKIKKKRKVTIPCGHCKESGVDICHHCSGTGRDGLGYGVPLEDIENYPKCLYCSGKGTPELVVGCCMCKGKRKEEFDESYEVPCPTCNGSGWIRNW